MKQISIMPGWRLNPAGYVDMASVPPGQTMKARVYNRNLSAIKEQARGAKIRSRVLRRWGLIRGTQ